MNDLSLGQPLSTNALRSPGAVAARYWCTLYNGRVAVVCYKNDGSNWWQVVDAWRVDGVLAELPYPMPAWAH